MKWMCLGGHSGTCASSPHLTEEPEVNLLSAAAVLFRGGTYTELSDWFQTMSVHMIGTTSFYIHSDIQKAYLHHAIENVHMEKITELLARVY